MHEELYKKILNRVFNVSFPEEIKGLTLGEVESAFFVGYEEVKIHRLFSCKKKNFRYDLFFLERGSLYSLCKYIIWNGSKICDTRVFPYVYQDLESFCSRSLVQIPHGVREEILSVFEKDVSKKVSKKKKTDKDTEENPDVLDSSGEDNE